MSTATTAVPPPVPFKRSRINGIVRDADAFFRRCSFHLPKFAHWAPDEWRSRDPASIAEITTAELGWDITDFGRGEFDKFGLVLFTIRNGIPAGKAVKEASASRVGCPSKTYCEKAMLVRRGQRTPMHFHWHKTEDIICRGGDEGATLHLKLYNADRTTEELDEHTPVTASVDGVLRTVPAGGIVVLEPGESITLPPYLYHTFWAEGGDCFIGEVSLVNDDNTDNRFAEPIGRFPTVEEDEAPVWLLTKDYAAYVGAAAAAAAGV